MKLSETEIEHLLQEAKMASRRAHCPYSRFPVGAAVLGGDGEVFSGCNVENASSGLTVCAERVAVFKAIAQGRRDLRAVLIYTPTTIPSAPCGACRQVLAEFAQDLVIVCCCDGTSRLVSTLAELLPQAFGPANRGLPV